MITIFSLVEQRWAINLAPQMTGRAQEPYAVMGLVTADCRQVEKAILYDYDISEEACSVKFQTVRMDREACAELATRLKNLAMKWLVGCESVTAFIEKPVMEQLLDTLSVDL